MKTLRLILLLPILISSCKSSNYKKELNCDYVEITHYNGWTGGSTIHISRDLTFKKCYYHIISDIDSCSCYIDTLSGKYYGRINAMIDSLKDAKIDTMYNGNCEDCGGFNITIQYHNKIVKSMIIGVGMFDNRIYRLARFINDMPINKFHSDSCQIYKTTSFMIPPKPIYGVDFKPSTKSDSK